MYNTSTAKMIAGIVIICLISSSATAQSYHTIVGVFEYEQNAKRFTCLTQSQFVNTFYAYNPEKNLYYVCALNTPHKDEALLEIANLRKKSLFKDAWLYAGHLDSPVTASCETPEKMSLKIVKDADEENQPKSPCGEHPAYLTIPGHAYYDESSYVESFKALLTSQSKETSDMMVLTNKNTLEGLWQNEYGSYPVETDFPVNSSASQYYASTETRQFYNTESLPRHTKIRKIEITHWEERWVNTEDVDYNFLGTPVIAEKWQGVMALHKDGKVLDVLDKNVLHKLNYEVSKSAGRFVQFSIEDVHGKIIPGNIHLVNYEKERDVAIFNTKESIALRPKNTSHSLTAVCGIFGYKQEIQFIDFKYHTLAEEARQNELGIWEIPFKLKPLEKGDVSVMYNVSFHTDAAIALSESKAEMDILVNMMRSNPENKIRIHAHCNGSHKRTVKTAVNSKNYFSIEDAKEFEASAKELTILRAEMLRSYLTDNGIDKSRIDIFPWGGKYKLVDKNSPHAPLNDRIEIEIL